MCPCIDGGAGYAQRPARPKPLETGDVVRVVLDVRRELRMRQSGETVTVAVHEIGMVTGSIRIPVAAWSTFKRAVRALAVLPPPSRRRRRPTSPPSPSTPELP